MSDLLIHFNKQDRLEFFQELRARVNKYFKDNQISKRATLKMKIKTLFMLVLYLAPFILILTGLIANTWLFIGMWILMGLGMSGIGLSIIHDANHGSYSRKKWVNQILGSLLNYIGAYHVNWKIQHNVLHHSFTNIEGYDEDLDIGMMRFSPGQKRKKLYYLQAFYAPFLYGFMTMYKIFFKDFIQIASYGKKGLLKKQGLTKKKAMIQMLLYKTLYLAVLIALPILITDYSWMAIILGFFIMQFVSGLLLALVFQSAHIVNETSFYQPDENNSVENNWAIHQMQTTANFARKSILFSWFIGGLNYQIEHHLFPNICHVHYPAISSIVKETALEHEVPYYEHKTFLRALKSHFSLLNGLGTGKYDKTLKVTI